MKANLLIVDDEEMIRGLLVSTLTKEGWFCYEAGNSDDGSLILQNQEIDLALLDIMMPGNSGMKLLEELKTTCPDTSVLMVTAMNDMDIALSCIRMGADDYIVKPFNIDRVVLTIRNSLEKRRLLMENKEYQKNLEIKVLEQTRHIRSAMEEINLSYEHTLRALIRALDAREKEIGSHSERVRNYTILLAKAWGIGEQELSIITKGTLLHDIGKIGVADSILLKDGKLSANEWIEMKKHPLVGFEIISGITPLKGAAEFVLAHHERYDGTGYPFGLKGKEIPLSARIFSLADTLDAMTSDRPYRKALSFQAVIEEVIRCNGTQFDPEIVKVFLGIPKSRWEEAAGKKFL